MIGGYGCNGFPENLINALVKGGSKDLTVVANNPGFDDFGAGNLFASRRVKRAMVSITGGFSEFEELYIAGQLEVEFIPQGTLAERLRAGGSGIPAFYTPTGYGTVYQDGKTIIKYDADGMVEISGEPKDAAEFEGRNYLLEHAITGDFALVKAWKADTAGNLMFRKVTRNFNPIMCKAAKTSIVEVEEIVPAGELDPEHIHVPGIYVDRIIARPTRDKRVFGVCR